MKTVLLTVGVWAVFAWAATTSSQATPAFALQTGRPCNACHTRPPALNQNGKEFKANGNRCTDERCEALRSHLSPFDPHAARPWGEDVRSDENKNDGLARAQPILHAQVVRLADRRRED